MSNFSSPVVKVEVGGARGASVAEVARRTGAYGATPSDTDQDVMDRFAEYAIERNPGFQSNIPGPANNTYTSYTALQESDPTRKYAYLAGDTDVNPRPDGPYSNTTGNVGEWLAQPAAGIQTTDGDLQSVLDERKPVTVTLVRYAIELNDDAAWVRALSQVSGPGGKILIPARDIATTKTWFIPSNVTVDGIKDVSRIIFDCVNPATLTGSPTNPRWGNPRSTAIVMAGTNLDDMGVYSDNHTGDYSVADLRAFAGDTTLIAGASSSFDSSGPVDVVAGDYIYLERGWIGWHTAVHEMVQVASVVGSTINLTKQVRYGYSNAANDPFNDFMDRFGYAGGPPPGVDAAAFNARRQCGWRPVKPVVNARVSNLIVRTISNHPGYANLAIGIIRAFNATIENVRVEGGGVWNLDSHGTTFSGLSLDRYSSSYAQTDFLPGNGSTATTIINLNMKGGNLDIEEGTCDLRIDGGLTFGHVFFNQFNRDIRVTNFDVAQNSGYAVRVEKSAQVSIRGNFLAPQPAVQYGTKDFFAIYPGATLAHWRAVGEYFDGANFRVEPGSFVYSTANNSLELYGEQSFVADGVELGGVFGDFYSIPDANYGYAIGSVRRRIDQARVASPRVSAKPAFYPKSLTQTVFDSTNDRSWSVVNQGIKTAANAPSATTFTVNSIASGGGVKAGDVARVLIENAGGTARGWHYSVVQDASPDTGLVTLATAVPNAWTVKLGTDGVQYFARWG